MGRQKTIMLLITYKCNLHCSYCYEPKQQNFRMSATKAKQIITEQLSLLGDDYDSVEIQFMGGEPLLEFPLIKEVSEWLWSLPLNKKLMVLFAPTNGTLLNDETKHWFFVNRERIHLGLSFDGNQAMQDINRSKSYKSVDLDYFVKTWPDQSVKMTISPKTVKCMSDGVIYLHKKGFKYISADLAMGPNLLWTNAALRDYQSELRKLSNFYLENPGFIPFSMLRLELTPSIFRKRNYVKTCSCGEDMVCVDWTGKSYACHLFSPVAIPIDKAERSNRIYDFSNHDQFNSERCSKCILNNVCIHCYGMNYLCSNDVTRPSPFHCSAFKIMFAANCRFRLMQAEQDCDEKKISEIINIINRISS